MSAFQVIAEPHRRHILDLLREGERSVNELVLGLGLSQPGVSKHLRVLREAGLVRARSMASGACTPCARSPWTSSTVAGAPPAALERAPRRPRTAPGPAAEETHADDRPTADGIVEQRSDGSTQVRFARRIPHPIERVWRR